MMCPDCECLNPSGCFSWTALILSLQAKSLLSIQKGNMGTYFIFTVQLSHEKSFFLSLKNS